MGRIAYASDMIGQQINIQKLYDYWRKLAALNNNSMFDVTFRFQKMSECWPKDPEALYLLYIDQSYYRLHTSTTKQMCSWTIRARPLSIKRASNGQFCPKYYVDFERFLREISDFWQLLSDFTCK